MLKWWNFKQNDDEQMNRVIVDIAGVLYFLGHSHRSGFGAILSRKFIYKVPREKGEVLCKNRHS